MSSQISFLKEQLESTRLQLLSHPVYTQINDLEGLQKFSEVHVFAVWDFMSLLKSLQIGLTSVSLPWMPIGSANTRFLINEIVAGEESDVDEQGNRISHFELYLQAMHQMGASTKNIDELIQQLKSGLSIDEAIKTLSIANEVKEFLLYTFEIAMHAPIHVKAAVFTFGREDLIPEMFTQILKDLYEAHPQKVQIFKYYIERHIEVDGGHHSILATEMVQELCGKDQNKWDEALAASLKSLKMRSLLWDAILQEA